MILHFLVLQLYCVTPMKYTRNSNLCFLKETHFQSASPMSPFGYLKGISNFTLRSKAHQKIIKKKNLLCSISHLSSLKVSPCAFAVSPQTRQKSCPFPFLTPILLQQCCPHKPPYHFLPSPSALGIVFWKWFQHST